MGSPGTYEVAWSDGDPRDTIKHKIIIRKQEKGKDHAMGPVVRTADMSDGQCSRPAKDHIDTDHKSMCDAVSFIGTHSSNHLLGSRPLLPPLFSSSSKVHPIIIMSRR
jgi:hypothetical protein